MTTNIRTARTLRRTLAATILGGATLLAGGCSDAQTGTFLGGAVGALAGQAIGNDTEATLIGTAVGAGVGYAVGNESDKQRDRYRYDRRHYDY